jgi:hypothetical protein
MGRTKKRGGAKAHRKRVQARNARLKGEMNQMQKLWQEQMMAQLEGLRSEDGENLELNLNANQAPKINMGDVELPNADENTPLDIKL